MENLSKNSKLVIIGMSVLLAFLVGLGIWIGMQTPNTDTTNSATKNDIQASTSTVSTQEDDNTINVPTFSVKQQVADSLDVNADELKDTNRRVRVKSTIVDASVFQEGDTIDKLMATGETTSASLLTQVETTATLYDYDADTYAVKLNNIDNAGITSGVKDIAFARDNYNGEVVDGITYDWDAGLAYVPKAVVDDYVPVDASEDQGNVLQAQLLYTMDADKVTDVALQTCSVTNETTGETVQTYAGSELWSTDTYVQLVSEEDANKVDVTSLKITANDGAVAESSDVDVETDDTTVQYNRSTGWLKISNSALGLGNLSVSLDSNEVSLASNDEASLASALSQMGYIRDRNGEEVSFSDNFDTSGLYDYFKSHEGGDWKSLCTYFYGAYETSYTDLDGSSVYSTTNVTDGASYNYITTDQWISMNKYSDFSPIKNVRKNQNYSIHLTNDGSLTDFYGQPWGRLYADDDEITRAVGGNWDFNKTYSSQMYQAICTHVSSAAVSETSNATKLFTKIVDVDPDEGSVTLGFVAGCRVVGGQTCAMVAKFHAPLSKGGINLHKASSNEDITGLNADGTDANRCYTRAGAVYEVFDDSWNLAWTLTTDAAGNASTGEKALKKGWYHVREKSPSNGYGLDTTGGPNGNGVYDVEVKPNEMASVNGGTVYDVPQNDPVGILLGKVDAETTKNNPLGGGTLKGAQFEVTYYDVQGYDNQDGVGKSVVDEIKGKASTSRSWVFETDGDGYCDYSDTYKVSGDELYKQYNQKDYGIPLGTIVIHEKSAPTGYVNNNEDKYWVRSVTSSVNTETVDTYNPPDGDTAIKEQVKRGDFSFSKKMQGTSNRGKWIPFLLINKKSGEAHVVVTDENGTFDSTRYPHSQNTNAMDAIFKETTDANGFYVEVNGKKYTYNTDWVHEVSGDAETYSYISNGKKYEVDEDKIIENAYEYGIWFGSDGHGNTAAVNDDQCALPYGTEDSEDAGYILQELPTNNNFGYNLITTNVNVRRDQAKIEYGTIDDEQKPTIMVEKLSSDSAEYVEGATLLLEKLNDQGEWEKVEEWVSDAEPKRIINQSIGKYRLTETLTPKIYEQAKPVEFEIFAGETLKIVQMKDDPISITGEVDKRENKIYELADDGSYFYTVDYRSTSNVWADEMNMVDTIDCADAGYAYLQYVNTPVLQGDYDGKMNVWYKTNKADATDSTDADKYNACSTNPENPHNKDNSRVRDFTGWKLWKADVSTIKSETLKVANLSLASGEYITGVAFEHGRVEVGASTALNKSNQWSRDAVKNESDFIDETSDNFMTKTVSEDGIVSVAHKDTFEDADGNKIAYQPAVFGMLPTEEALADENIEYKNTADVDIHRNYASDEKVLNDDDADAVVQKTSMIYISKMDATTGAEVEGATLVLEIRNDDGSWRKIDEWVSTGEPHKKGGVIGARYRLTETFAPKTYSIADPVEFTFNGDGANNKVIMKDEPISITGEIDKRESALYDVDENGGYIYTIDYRNTSNVWADEMNMWDVIDCAIDGKAYFEYVNTPVFYGDYDGEMNVWYKTNKTPEDYVEPEDEDGYVPNACATNPENPHNPYNERVHDFTGWKCLCKVGTLESVTITTKDFDLDDDEYITGIAFEHGRVEVGAGTLSQDSNQWKRDFLKDESDIIDANKDAYLVKTVDKDGITTVKHGVNFNDADGNVYTYQPVVIGMRATEEVIKEGGVELWNTADMDIHRNLAPDESKLNNDDEDKVVLKTPRIVTTLTDKATGTNEGYPSKDTTLVDKVEYEGLISGKEYSVSGKLYDKSTGEPLLINDKEITTRENFTPVNAEGTTEIEFTFDSSTMLGKSTVAFEDLYFGEKVIYSENDINNAAQTVSFKETPTVQNEAKKGGYYDKTGNDLDWALIMLSTSITISSAVAGCWCMRKAGGIAAVKLLFKK